MKRFLAILFLVVFIAVPALALAHFGGPSLVTTQYTNSAIAVGEVAGSATAAVFPTITAKMVMIKAVASNAGNVYIGIAGVTVVDGSTDTTTGFELGAGESTGWIPATNLNLFYRICDNAGDDVTYMVLQ